MKKKSVTVKMAPSVVAKEIVAFVGIIGCFLLSEIDGEEDWNTIPDANGVKFVDWFLHSLAYWSMYASIITSVGNLWISFMEGETVNSCLPCFLLGLSLSSFTLDEIFQTFVLPVIQGTVYEKFFQIPDDIKTGYLISYGIPQVLIYIFLLIYTVMVARVFTKKIILETQ